MTDKNTYSKVDNELVITSSEPVTHTWARMDLERLKEEAELELEIATKDISKYNALLAECEKLGL